MKEKEKDTMNTIQVKQNTIPQQQNVGYRFSSTMVTDFVTWLDRSEKTTKTYMINLKQFVAWMKYQGVKNPTRDDVIKYRDWLQTEHDAIQLDPTSTSGWSYKLDHSGHPVRMVCKANTVRAYIRSVKQFFEWTENAGFYPNVAKNIHTPKTTTADEHLRDGLTPEEILTIEDHIKSDSMTRQAEAITDAEKRRKAEQDARLLAIYMLASNAGLRTIEISRANVKDLVVKNGNAILYVWGKGKAGPDTAKPLADEVYQAVKAYIDLRSDRPTGTSPLFVSTSNRSAGQRLQARTIGSMLKTAMQDAGFDSERITAHSLRHSAGTAVMEVTGQNIYKAQKYMRHQDPKTTEIYIHDSDDKLQQKEIATDVYNLYHNKKVRSVPDDLMSKIDKLTPDQLKQLNAIAGAMIAS